MRHDPSFSRNLYRDQTPGLARTLQELSSALFAGPSAAHARLEVYRPTFIEALSDGGRDQSLELSRDDQTKLSQPHSKSVDGRKSHHGHDEAETLLESITSIKELDFYMRKGVKLQAYFVRQRNSYAELSTTHTLLSHLFEARDLSAQFLDYILYFGRGESEVEIVPPPIKLRQSECMLAIRFVELNKRTDVSQPSALGSLRQSALCFRMDPLPRVQTWVFVTISESFQSRLNEYLFSLNTIADANVFAVLWLLFDTVAGNWRPYIAALTMETNEHAAQLLGASPDNRGPVKMSDAGERQALMILDEKIANALLVIKATREDIRLLLERDKCAFPSPDTQPAKCPGYAQLAFHEKIAEMDRLVIRLDSLRSRVSGIASLVSNFLELSNGFALQELGKETRNETEGMMELNGKMHALAEKSAHEAAGLNVLTIINLISLPTTVLSNFLSTSFVGTGVSGGIYVTHDWWIFVASSVPLTILTLYIWWVWSRIQAYQTYPWWWLSNERPTGVSHSNTISRRERKRMIDTELFPREAAGMWPRG